MTYLDLLPKDVLDMVNRYKQIKEREEILFNLIIIELEQMELLAAYFRTGETMEKVNSIFQFHGCNIKCEPYFRGWFISGKPSNLNILILRDLIKLIDDKEWIKRMAVKFDLPL